MHTYEVFLKKDGRDEFRHAGALDAATDELALVLARESYVRRGEGDLLWLVRRDHLLTGGPELLAPNADKPHRHHDGQAVAARRKAARSVTAEPVETVEPGTTVVSAETAVAGNTVEGSS